MCAIVSYTENCSWRTAHTQKSLLSCIPCLFGLQHRGSILLVDPFLVDSVCIKGVLEADIMHVPSSADIIHVPASTEQTTIFERRREGGKTFSLDKQADGFGPQ